MIPISDNGFFYLLSSNAQVFGALLGLLGLAFVRVAETMDRNFDELFRSFMRDILEFLKKANREGARLEVHLNSFEDVGPLLDQHRPRLGEAEYQLFLRRYASIKDQIQSRKSIGKTFRQNCWLSAFAIILSIAGLVIPSTAAGGFRDFHAIGLLAFSIFALVRIVQFFISVSVTQSVYVFSAPDEDLLPSLSSLPIINDKDVVSSEQIHPVQSGLQS